MTEPPPAPAETAPARSRGCGIWRQFRRHRGAMLGLLVLAAILLFAGLGPLVWRLDPGFVDIRARNQGFGAAHPLGTDQLGRDLLARLMAGGRVTLAVGLAAMAVALGFGSLVGIAAGWSRRLDAPLMRLTELFLALPLLPLLLLMVMLFREPLARAMGPAGGSFLLIVAAIGATSWMQTARILRGEVLALKEREFILAAVSTGTPTRRMILRHVVPNVVSPMLVAATLGIAAAIVTESALSFLGLGFPPDFPTWGRLLYDAVDQMQLYPWRVVLPGLLISLTVLSVNYVGDGLRDAMDPRQRHR
ncbi:peptide/nickel transport system permease protein [Paracoccus aminovorans]|uniref:Peptide/nickel transport system permease protein n=1 Tax=Paracoccus aminovorans TaxID=34004 RepID=A0A1I3C0T8_9RHOB|nr:ABC transporter permease [Paracoccus aminovorans]CQR87043.1 dipeptide/oligopeptide/nickel ABC transporter permease [Paracoccus aminovorans]SFH68070.1 peptide/nickel transport system permease protein [Paracoccus aminovorans]